MQPDREAVSSLSVDAGNRLRETRQRQGLTLQRVEQLGAQIAAAFNNQEFAIPMSRLSHIERNGVVPSIYRVHSLARIYRLTPETILEWYGIKQATLDALQLEESPHGRFAFFRVPREVQVPVAVDPSFDPRFTAELGRVIEAWGEVPLTFLKRFRDREFIYAYVGADDFMMSPLLPPGSFVQIDPSRRAVKRTGWQNENDRPIYAIDSSEGLHFCWCSIAERKLIMQPHPLSSEDIKIYSTDDVEIVGQVVGFARRFKEASSALSAMPSA
jgi:transcriptional regulator with XRE-family HTH domain